jgi:hypothetical protein
MTGTEKVIFCVNEAKNVAIAIAANRIFNEVSEQMNESECLGYFTTIP